MNQTVQENRLPIIKFLFLGYMCKDRFVECGYCDSSVVAHTTRGRTCAHYHTRSETHGSLRRDFPLPQKSEFQNNP